MRISVIIPFYNGEKHLAALVRSVSEQIKEEHELILVDDGSTDSSLKLARTLGPGIQVFEQPRKGVAAARNAGIRYSSGDLLCLMDVDDLWPPNSLQRLLSVIQQTPSLEVAMGHVQYFQSKLPEQDTLSAPLVGPCFGAALIRRSLFDRIGLLDESLQLSEDHDWFLRAREAHAQLLVIHETTLLVRRHAANSSRGKSWKELGLAEVLRKSIERRRNVDSRLRKLSDYSENSEVPKLLAEVLNSKKRA